MYDLLVQESAKHGDCIRVVPIETLKLLKDEMQLLANKENINSYQKYLIEEYFSFEKPELAFTPHSLIIAATPCTAGKVIFHYNENPVSVTVPATYWDYSVSNKRVKTYMKEALSKEEYQVKLTYRLPNKLLAVKSGLAEYGRNNIAYVKEMGSYVNFIVLYSDLPCDKTEISDLKVMDSCGKCRICQVHCPTGAISAETFLLNTDKCLTYHNEAGEEAPFPEWIPAKAHNALIGCIRCQEACPKNGVVKETKELAEFTEEETQLILSGCKKEELTESVIQKLKSMELSGYSGGLPRNLRALLN